MKKYLLFFAAFALLLVGCAQNEVIEDRSEKNVIGFRTLNDKVTRKANDANSPYVVYAKWSEASAAWFMKDVVVTPDGDGPNDAYSPLQYWPHDGTVDFYAYAPKVTNAVVAESPVTSLKITYTVPTDAQEDFTVATPITGAKSSTHATVPLQFKHMLSKIEVDAKLDDALGHETTGAGYTMEFASAKLTVNKNQGEVNLQDGSPALTVAGSSATYTGEKTYMVLPQDAPSVKLQLMGVVIKHNNVQVWPATSMPVTDLKEYTIAGTDLAKFEAGKHYKITFAISNDAKDSGDADVFQPAITFSSTVATWTDGTVSIDQPGV